MEKSASRTSGEPAAATIGRDWQTESGVNTEGSAQSGNGLSLLELFSERSKTGGAVQDVGRELNLVAFADPEQLVADGRRHRRHHKEHEGRHKLDDPKNDLKKDLPPEKDLRDGDIIFRSTDRSEEAKAIQLVSKSPLVHCGILIKEGNDWYVYEAVEPVAKTLLKDFHTTADNETYCVRRLKDADKLLTATAMQKMKDYLKDNVGKDYDHKFGWGNDRMYCSELVWKAYYDATRVKVGKLQMVGDYDLSDPLVKKHVQARYGKDVPITEPTVTPGAVYLSRLLKTVK